MLSSCTQSSLNAHRRISENEAYVAPPYGIPSSGMFFGPGDDEPGGFTFLPTSAGSRRVRQMRTASSLSFDLHGSVPSSPAPDISSVFALDSRHGNSSLGESGRGPITSRFRGLRAQRSFDAIMMTRSSEKYVKQEMLGSQLPENSSKDTEVVDTQGETGEFRAHCDTDGGLKSPDSSCDEITNDSKRTDSPATAEPRLCSTCAYCNPTCCLL